MIGFISGIVIQTIQHRYQSHLEKQKYDYQSRPEVDKIRYQLMFEAIKSSGPEQARIALKILQARSSSLPSTDEFVEVLLDPKISTVHPMTRVKAVLRETTHQYEYYVDWLNEKANEFYGASSHSKEFSGALVKDLVEQVRPWMRPEDFERFMADQTRARAQFEAEGFAVAKVPFRFTDDHPNNHYRNREFLPVMSEAWKVEDERHGKALCAYVLYYDLDFS